MQEQEILIEGIDPKVIFGINNDKLRHLTAYFPKLKIVSRGQKVIVIGNEDDINAFGLIFEKISTYVKKFNKISDDDITAIIEGDKAFLKAPSDSEVIVFGNAGLKVTARTANQKLLVEAIDKDDMLFAIGPAGTGKTYTSVALAVRALKRKEVRKIILTRPAVEAGEHLGFLPGDLKEKLDPYLQPLYDALNDMIPPERLADYIENNVIQIAPLAFMRGRTLDKAFVILDEAQNTTSAQMKMFLTRMGKSAKFVITGDETQVDLPKQQQSGLRMALRVLKDIEGISIVRLDGRDVIRHPLVKKVITAFDKEDKQ